MKWKKLLSKQNARHYAWPAGWDPAEVIAEQLECSPERVREHLSPSIRAGEVEVKVFTIWDEETGRKIQKTGFRIAGKASVSSLNSPNKVIRPKNRQKSVDHAPKPDRWPFWEGAVVKRMDRDSTGVVKNGCVHWKSGDVTRPTSKNATKKLRLVS